MTIEQLKSSIENKSLDDRLIIFINSQHNFIAKQYIQEIADIKNKKIVYIDDILSLVTSADNLFEADMTSDCINVCYQDNFETYTTELDTVENLIIVCDNIKDKELRELYAPFIIEMPELCEWQIKDYIYSNLPGIEHNICDWLYDIAKGDIYRLDQEIAKLKLFSESEQKYNIDDFIRDDIFSDLSSYTIFNLTNAILKKDIATISQILQEIENIDVEAIGLVTILYNNFKNIINVQLTNYATAEKLGMKAKQFNAIRYNCGHYSKESLTAILEMLTSIDERIKTGEMPIDILRDYLIIKTLSL